MLMAERHGYVRISFHHANPTAGNESFLLRFESSTGEASCILVDAGNGVDVDALLRPEDDLVGICLTHAHLDHYKELAAAHRGDVPIFASPWTAAILGDVFEIATTEYAVTSSTSVSDAVTPISEWTELATGIEIHPVPAGHAPGAVGFLVRVTDGDQSHHLLATGDFTCRSAAGFPGFDPHGFVDVDVLFLTGATNEQFGDSLTESLGTAVEHAHGGSQTLVTTSGIVGVQVAYLLSALVEKHDLQVPIRVVGHVAKLYDAFEYDCPGVEAIPKFEHTDECLETGTIVIAGPEVPRERSSGRLFGVLREDPNACVVQLIGSGEDPIHNGQCTVHDYELVNHPSLSTLREVHDAIQPTETVITHRRHGAKDTFNDLSSPVWGAGDRDEYLLFDGNQWQQPPWMGGGTAGEPDQTMQQFASAELMASFSVPSMERHDTPDLGAEGIDEERIADLLNQGPKAVVSPDVPESVTDQPDSKPTDETTDSPIMTANDTDHSNSKTEDAETANKQPKGGLVRTTGASVGGELDPALQHALEQGELTKEDLTEMLDASKHVAQQNADTNSEETSGETNQENEPKENAASESETSSKEEEAESGDEPTEPESPSDTGEDTSSDIATEETGSNEESKVEATTNAADEGSDTSKSNGSESDIMAENPQSRNETEDVTPRAMADSETDSNIVDVDNSLTLELNPLAVKLVDVASSNSAIADEGDSVDDIIVSATGDYITALLAGEASGNSDEQFIVNFEASASVEAALHSVGTDRLIDSSSSLDGAIGAIIGEQRYPSREIANLKQYQQLLEAIVQNEEYSFEATSEVVEAAIVWFLASQ
ncbi:MBL fold metallo-hydrolase [Natranaeroarchaeum sulfidigenes]|nr:MBL fold metallo-hydrolase [Natranaeroarchaeum sulfidigenes]